MLVCDCRGRVHEEDAGGAGLLIVGWAPLLMRFVVARVDDPTLTPLLLVLLPGARGDRLGVGLEKRGASRTAGNDIVTLGLSKSSEERS